MHLTASVRGGGEQGETCWDRGGADGLGFYADFRGSPAGEEALGTGSDL